MASLCTALQLRPCPSLALLGWALCWGHDGGKTGHQSRPSSSQGHRTILDIPYWIESQCGPGETAQNWDSWPNSLREPLPFRASETVLVGGGRWPRQQLQNVTGPQNHSRDLDSSLSIPGPQPQRF